MWSILRKIRKQLVGSGNLRKYLVYALGEIILVVIGILIALQINTWKNSQEDDKLRQLYLSRLITEIEQDIDHYGVVVTGFENKERSIRNIMDIWLNERVPLEDSVAYINYFGSAGLMNKWYNEPVTWTELIQTGDLKLIDDPELTFYLFSYYNGLKKTADDFDEHPSAKNHQARDQFIKAFQGVPMEEYMRHSTSFTQVPPERVYDYIWDHKEEYMLLYTQIAYSCGAQKVNLGQQVAKGQQVLEELKKRIK